MRKNITPLGQRVSKFPVFESFCPICKSQIFNYKGKPLPNQCQFTVVLNSGQAMEIGLCHNCFTALEPWQVHAIFEGIKEWHIKNGWPHAKDLKVTKMLPETVW